MVFYGLAVALMAASVSKTYSDVSKITSGEATSLAALYRNVGGYPEPISTRCSLTFATTDQIIHGAAGFRGFARNCDFFSGQVASGLRIRFAIGDFLRRGNRIS